MADSELIKILRSIDTRLKQANQKLDKLVVHTKPYDVADHLDLDAIVKYAQDHEIVSLSDVQRQFRLGYDDTQNAYEELYKQGYGHLFYRGLEDDQDD